MAADRDKIDAELDKKIISFERSIKGNLLELSDPVSDYHQNLPDDFRRLFFAFSQFRLGFNHKQENSSIWNSLYETGLEGIKDQLGIILSKDNPNIFILNESQEIKENFTNLKKCIDRKINQ